MGLCKGHRRFGRTHEVTGQHLAPRHLDHLSSAGHFEHSVFIAPLRPTHHQHLSFGPNCKAQTKDRRQTDTAFDCSEMTERAFTHGGWFNVSQAGSGRLQHLLRDRLRRRVAQLPVPIEEMRLTFCCAHCVWVLRQMIPECGRAALLHTKDNETRGAGPAGLVSGGGYG